MKIKNKRLGIIILLLSAIGLFSLINLPKNNDISQAKEKVEDSGEAIVARQPDTSVLAISKKDIEEIIEEEDLVEEDIDEKELEEEASDDLHIEENKNTQETKESKLEKKPEPRDKVKAQKKEEPIKKKAAPKKEEAPKKDQVPKKVEPAKKGEQAKPEPKPQPKPEPKPQPKPEPKPEPKPQPKPKPEPIPDRIVQIASMEEQEVVRYVNIERNKAGLNPLKSCSKLSKVARDKSIDMAENSYLAHTSPKYGDPFQMMKSYGIKFSSAAENIASGQISAKFVVDQWMKSEGHKKNILNPNFTTIGVGFRTKQLGTSSNYWTQMFTN